MASSLIKQEETTAGESGTITNVHESRATRRFSSSMCCSHSKEMDAPHTRGEMCGRNATISEENESEGGTNASADIGQKLLEALRKRDGKKVLALINEAETKGIQVPTLENLKLCNFIADLELLKESSSVKYLWRQVKRELGDHEDEERLKESDLEVEKTWIEIFSDPQYICLDWWYRTDPDRRLQPSDTSTSCTPDEKEDVLKTALRYAYLLEHIPTYEHRLSKDEYRKKAERLEDFAADVIEECNSEQGHKMMDLKGSGCLLNGNLDKYINSVSLLKFAADKKRKKFVTSPKCQNILNEIIYYKWPHWQNKTLLVILLWSLLQLIFVAFSAWIYIPLRLIGRCGCDCSGGCLANHLCCGCGAGPRGYRDGWCSFRQRYEHPYYKFVNHNLSYLLFLSFIFLNSFGEAFGTKITDFLDWKDWVVLSFIVCLSLQESLEAFRQGFCIYLSKWWNWVDVLIVLMFWTSYGIWIFSLVRFGFKWEPQENVFIIADVFYAGASIVAYFHLTHVFQVHSTMGPLQLSLYKMLKDVLRFLFIFLLLYISFATGVVRLYSYYVSSQRALHHPNSTRSAESYHPYADRAKTLIALFWFLLGNVDEEKIPVKDRAFQLTSTFALIFFMIYVVCMVIVALNMLVAMMNNSFERIMEDEDIQWKFSRTQMWLEWIDKGNTIPVPLNIFYRVPYFAILFYGWLKPSNSTCSSCCTPAVKQVNKEMYEDRIQTMRYLVEKYLENNTQKPIEDPRENFKE